MSNFQEAVRRLIDDDAVCPKCDARNIPHARPTLEREQNGSLTCQVCSHNFYPNKETV